MSDFAPSYSIERDITRRELHWSASGHWTEEEAVKLPKALFLQSLVFIEKGQKFRVLGDLREFHVQNQDVVEVMRGSQEGAAQNGVERMAIVLSSTLLKLQFRRISAGLNLEFFETKEEALLWLRAED
jgi:hypothetical protein